VPGVPLALLLARAGHKVALVDRASFPSDTMSTHFLWQRGAARLKGWGLLGALEARGCAPIKQITFDVGPVQLTGIGPAVGGVAETYCPRRTVLDALLAGAAEEAGAELIEGFVAGDVLWSEGRAVGVRGHHRTSPGSSLPARGRPHGPARPASPSRHAGVVRARGLERSSSRLPCRPSTSSRSNASSGIAPMAPPPTSPNS
jgi:flavin-dependent dehydrogenase